jgi:hypothetical protein
MPLPSTRDLAREAFQANPKASAWDVTRYVAEKKGVTATYVLAGTMLKQLKQELGIATQEQLTKIKKKKGPGRPLGSKTKSKTKSKKSDEYSYAEAAPTEKKERKKSRNRLYYKVWECSLEGISASSERDLTDKLKDFIETLNDIRAAKFEMLEIANPRKIEVRESN